MERPEEEVNLMHFAIIRCQHAFNDETIDSEEVMQSIFFVHPKTKTRVLINAIENGYKGKHGYFSELTTHTILFWIEQEIKNSRTNKLYN